MKIKCVYCQSEARQVKDGRTRSGSQQYRCRACERRYTPEPKQAGYPDEVRLRAVQMVADGMSYRQVGRQLGVVHRTVGLWVADYAAQLPAPEQPPQPIAVIEQDELFTFIGRKKSQST